MSNISDETQENATFGSHSGFLAALAISGGIKRLVGTKVSRQRLPKSIQASDFVWDPDISSGHVLPTGTSYMYFPYVAVGPASV